MNIIQSKIEINLFGICVNYSQPNIARCAFEIHLSGNTITSFNDQGNYSGLQVLGGNNAAVNIHNCLNKNRAIMVHNTSGVVVISETEFTQNANGIELSNRMRNKKHLSMIITDSLFQENNGISLGVPYISTYFKLPKNLLITLKNVTFSNNTNLGVNTGILQVDKRGALSIEDSCVFRGNQGNTIFADSTTITLSGRVIFKENIAFERGGAILLRLSTLNLQSVNNTKTSIAFVNNKAKNVGGSIFISNLFNNINRDTGATESVCFYRVQGASLDQLRNSIITVDFVNNTAANGGNDIFNAALNSQCKIELKPPGFGLSNQIHKYIFKTSSGLSSITSDPSRVCLSDSSSQLMCANLSYIFYETERYPGEVFPLSLAVVGLEFGTVTGLVYAYLLPQANNSVSSLGERQHLRQSRAHPSEITQLNFTIHSLNSREIIVLTTNNTVISKAESREHISQILQEYDGSDLGVIPAALLKIYVYINITLLDCPPGFQLTSQGSCECSMALKMIGINDCSIYNRTSYITRNQNQWIDRIPNGILANKYCPFNYCKQGAMVINLDDPDQQCALNHTGTLCGACPPTLSLAIGSSRCLECSDNYPTLLPIAIAAAGIAIIIFIKVLDMTVAIGTINGLIFYANIIWANQSVLFPPQDQTSSLLQFLKVFIAWMNLDLGIETCFIEHLDGHWKTWLQFTFPAYIWLIIVLIILVSNYSTIATKIFGNNSVSVLATLFLLSYAKLLRTVLVILEYTQLEYPNGSRIVWSFDGNIKYFGWKHSVLFAVAIGILLLLWLPYTLVLLFIQCLRRHSHRRLLKWVNTLKPLIDCYLGPLKDKHHFWIGLGLLARLVLLLTSAATLTTAPYISVVALILTTFALGLLVLSVYKQWQLSVLEGCFLVNTAMFSSGALFIEAQGGSKDTLACISLGLAFTLFLVITAYHIFRRLRLLIKKRRRNTNHGYEVIQDSAPLPRQQDHNPWQSTTYQEVSVPQPRESLLENVT